MSDQNEEPKIIVDDDWKAQVETEKEAAEHEAESPAEEDLNELPEASFGTLVSSLATQAMVALGQIPDFMTGQASINKALAKHMIDTLAMLEEKTKRNLTGHESDMLTGIIHEMRMVYVNTPDQMPEGSAGGEEEKSSSIELP